MDDRFAFGGDMEPCTIRFVERGEETSCPLCGQADAGRRGPRLFVPGQADPVCRACGRKHAPGMAALLDLAQAAERVAPRCRHLLTPPMESLLDLARAAENYSNAAPTSPAAAG